MQQTFHLKTAQASRGLLGVFVPKRVELSAVTVKGLPAGVQVQPPQFNRAGVDVQWNPAVPLNTSFDLVLEVDGEQAELADILWRDSTGTFNLTDAAGSPLHDVLLNAASFQNLGRVTREIFKRRKLFVAQMPEGPLKRYSEFFLDLDSHTNPALLANAEKPPIPPEEQTRRNGIVRPMEKLLVLRVLARAEQFCRDSSVVKDLQRSAKSDTAYISDLLLGFFKTHFRESSPISINIDEAWRAFQCFANGELRVTDSTKVWNGQPDGSYEFCFAEFAFMAIELGVDLPEWTALLPVLVASQEIFARAYRPAGDIKAGFWFEDYSPLTFKHDQQVNNDFKQSLQDKYRLMSLDGLQLAAAQNAFLTFPRGAKNVPNQCFKDKQLAAAGGSS
jgi:hypothetical protein